MKLARYLSPVHPLTACLCCGSTRLWQYLDLGQQPLANAYHKGDGELPRYPLAVNLCEDCYHSQLTHAIDPDEMFQEYLYVSGTTASLRKHFEELAKDTVARLGKPTPRVLDIACNDGTLLECFQALGCRVYGIDPARNLRDITAVKGIPVLVDYWPTEKLRQFKYLGKGQWNEFDIITACNVLAHTADPLGFLRACREHLAPGGVVVVEFPESKQIWEGRAFDQIYSEHVSYFAQTSFACLASRARLQSCHALVTPIHGGSIRYYLRPSETPAYGFETGGVSDMLQRITCLSEQIQKNRADFRLEIDRQRASGRRVIGYGASAKGNTALNYFGAPLDYIVDDNSLKWGYLTPGQDIPIKDPSILRAEARPLAIVMLAWNFAAEVLGKVRELRKGRAGDVAVYYIPDVRVEPL